MIASVLIIAFSLVLLVYWFRYSCVLILRSQSDRGTIAADGRFGIADVQERLRTQQELDPLHRSLDRDYRILSYLLEHAVGLELQSFEDRLLVLDYRVMNRWYSLTRTAAPHQARHALREMASILEVLVRRISRQAGMQDEV